MIFVIIAIIIAYRRANEYGRSPIKWAVIAGATYIGTQLIVSLGAGMFIGLGIELWGWEERAFDDNMILITIVAILASLGTTWFAISRIKPQEEESIIAPPPPPTFNQ